MVDQACAGINHTVVSIDNIRRAVKDVPTRAVVPVDILIVVADALEVRAKLEGVFAVRPGQVVQRLNNLPALHSGVARAGGHIAVNQHLRRLRPLQIRLRNSQAGLRQERGGRVTLCLRGMLRVKAAAELIQQRIGEDIVMREGHPLVNLRRVIAALQRAARLRAIRKRAGSHRRCNYLAILVREARKDRLLVRDNMIQPNVALISYSQSGSNRRNSPPASAPSKSWLR